MRGLTSNFPMKGGMMSPKIAMKGSLRSLRAEKGCLSQFILGNQVRRTLIKRTSLKRQSHLASAAMQALIGGLNISMVVEKEEGEMQDEIAVVKAETVVVKAETLVIAPVAKAVGGRRWRARRGSFRVSVAGCIGRNWTTPHGAQLGLRIGLGLGLAKRERRGRDEVRRRLFMAWFQLPPLLEKHFVDWIGRMRRINRLNFCAKALELYINHEAAFRVPTVPSSKGNVPQSNLRSSKYKL